MPYTTYIEKCCLTLAEANEYPTDVYLVSLIRLQHFVRKIANSLPSNELEPQWSLTTPVGMYVKSLEEGLQRYRKSLPPDLLLSRESCPSVPRCTILILDITAPFLMHYHSVEIHLYEIGLSKPHNKGPDQSFQRLELLYACLLSAKSFVKAFFLIPAVSYYSISFVTWIQLSHTLTILCRLLLVNSEGWDIAHAREVVDFPAILQRLTEKFLEAKKITEAIRAIDPEKNTFYQYAQMMQWVKLNYESILSSESLGSQQSVDFSADEAMMGDFLNLDDDFWQDFVGDWGDSMS
jgi:hypothetical protein